MTTSIEHIVFDIGRVLIHYDPNIPFSRLIPDEKERQWFFDTICTHDWNVEQDRGRSWHEAEKLLIARHPDRESHIRAFRKHWREMVPYSYPEPVAAMERLIDEGRDVTMLTNFAEDTFAEAQEIFPFLKRPRGVTVSGVVKLIKPDVRIYELHAKSFGLEPSKTLFIDDSRANVEGARQAGWQAVLYTGPEKLAADLREFGLAADA
jgi:2-haloacid dehalogenase